MFRGLWGDRGREDWPGGCDQRIGHVDRTREWPGLYKCSELEPEPEESCGADRLTARVCFWGMWDIETRR